MKITTIISSLILLLTLGNANEIAESQQQWIEVYKKQANIPEAGAMLINQDEEPDLSDGFIDLYNGKDLKNWEPKGGNCTFEAKDETNMRAQAHRCVGVVCC